MDSKPKTFASALDQLEKLAGEKGQDFKERLLHEIEDLEAQIDQLKPKLEQLKEDAGEHLHKAKGKVEQQVKDNPWMVLGVVGLIAFIIGFLLRGGRRSR